jgi:DNA topoisomerase-3
METAGKLVDDEQLKEALKEKGLGTPATRASIIETLLGRGYIVREKKTLVATEAGRYLISLIRDRGLKSPELTGEWEARLREIERGQLDPGRFMDEIIGYAGGIIREAEGTAVDATRLGDCPRCGRPVIEGNRGYGCSGWREGCSFVLWKEYKGCALAVGQVRELLQRRVLAHLPDFEGSAGKILHLSDAGALLEIQIPQAASRPETVATKGPRTRRPKEARVPSDEPATETAPKKKAATKKASELGSCPLCGAKVVEQERAYGCSGWRDGCKFVIWKTIAGRKVSARTAQAFLKKGASPLLKGFKSKVGKSFDAKLKLENGAVRFDFG